MSPVLWQVVEEHRVTEERRVVSGADQSHPLMTGGTATTSTGGAHEEHREAEEPGVTDKLRHGWQRLKDKVSGQPTEPVKTLIEVLELCFSSDDSHLPFSSDIRSRACSKRRATSLTPTNRSAPPATSRHTRYAMGEHGCRFVFAH